MQTIIFRDNNIQINVDSDNMQVCSVVSIKQIYNRYIIDIIDTYAQINTDNPLSSNDDEDIKRTFEESNALELGLIESTEESFQDLF